ncbi:unnamed protein product [Boreogadus saida]
MLTTAAMDVRYSCNPTTPLEQEAHRRSRAGLYQRGPARIRLPLTHSHHQEGAGLSERPRPGLHSSLRVSMECRARQQPVVLTPTYILDHARWGRREKGEEEEEEEERKRGR